MRPVVHIGFAKTGTTTLQRNLLAMHRDVLNAGRPVWRDDAQPISDYLRGEAVQEEPAAKAWRALADEARDLGKVLVISAEGLSAPALYRGLERDWMGHRLKAIAGRVGIIITIRSQLEILESYFLHKSKFSSYRSPADWLAHNRDTIMRSIRYVEIIEHFQKVMGPENVGVFLFEQLRDDPTGFAEALCRFVGIDAPAGAALMRQERANMRQSARSFRYARLRARLLPGVRLGQFMPPPLRRRFHRYLKGGEAAQAKLPEAWRREIENYYREANASLSARLSLDLADYGYPT